MKMVPLEPAGADLLRRARAHSVAECEYPIAAQRLFALFEEGATWSEFFPVIRKVEWTSPRPFGVGTTRTVTVIGGVRLDEVFWAWKPSEDFNPMAILIPRFAPIRRIGFYTAFRDWRHGKPRTLDKAEADLFSFLGVSRERTV